MTKLREIELPNGIVEVYKQCIQDASDETILHFSKHIDTGFMKGLRPIKQNVPQIKKRLIGYISHNKKISKKQLVILEFYRPLGFFEDFVFKMLDMERDGFCSVYGRDKVVASLLLDERDCVRELAENIISGECEIKELSEKERKDFAGKAISFFNPFFTELFDVLNGDEEEETSSSKVDVVPSKQDKSHIDKLEKRIKELNHQNKRLTEERREYKRRAARSDEAMTAKAKADKENSKLRKRVGELESSLMELDEKYKELDAAIVATVDDRLHSILHTWIKRPEELEMESERGKVLGNQDVAIRAEAIIAKQAEVDKHTGNRRILLERLERLGDLKEQLEDIAIESINPLKELESIRQDLEREISHLQQLLGISANESGFMKSFMSRIGIASHPDDLSSCKQLLKSLNEFNVLSTVEMRTLYEYCDERMTLLYEKYIPTIGAPKTLIDPVYRLKRAIADNSDMLWLLDGHNILFLLPDMFGTVNEDGKHIKSSRLALSDFLVQLTKDAPACRVQLFFDGPEYNEIQVSSNVKVVYSGGEGDHRADDAICSVFEYQCYQSNNVPFLLTTDDKELSLRAERLGSYLMNINEFFALARAYMGQRG